MEKPPQHICRVIPVVARVKLHARMVGETFYNQVFQSDLVFVSTLNAETVETLFNSYNGLSRALGCT